MKGTSAASRPGANGERGLRQPNPNRRGLTVLFDLAKGPGHRAPREGTLATGPRLPGRRSVPQMSSSYRESAGVRLALSQAILS